MTELGTLIKGLHAKGVTFKEVIFGEVRIKTKNTIMALTYLITIKDYIKIN